MFDNNDFDEIFNDCGLEKVSENMLDLALSSYVITTDLDLMKKCIPVIASYLFRQMVDNSEAIDKLKNNRKKFEDDFVKKAMVMVKDCALQKLVSNDLIDVDFSDTKPKYFLTEKGKKVKPMILLTTSIIKHPAVVDSVLLEIKE